MDGGALLGGGGRSSKNHPLPARLHDLPDTCPGVQYSPPFLRATSGSAGVNLCAVTNTILRPEDGAQVIPTGVFGPPPPNTFFQIMGQASSTLQGVVVYPMVVDNDYTGEIRVLATATSAPMTLKEGQRIAQALPLPLDWQYPSLQNHHGSTQPGFSDVFWVQTITQERPFLKLKLDNQWFLGIVNTGANTTIISKDHWPSSWPLQSLLMHLQGIGQSKNTLQSSKFLRWEDSKGHSGLIQPFIVKALPVNLWGRDLLTQLGLVMCSPNEIVTCQML